MFLSQFRYLHPTTKRLLLTRTLRSIGQGALVVDFTLYLHALNWSPTAIGLLLTTSGIAASGLSLLVGLTSDILKRKPILFVYEAITLISSLAIIFSSQTWILIAASILGGFGHGSNGAAGPFSPAEQAWLAEEIPAGQRGLIYSLNAALGFFGMGIGALCAILPVIWSSVLPGAAAYRPLFGLVSLAALGGLLLLSGANEKNFSKTILNHQKGQSIDKLRDQENHALMKVVMVNIFNGFAVGLTGPLMSYWFLKRFGVGAESIAPVMAITFIITGVLSFYTGALTKRIGITSSVVLERFIGVVLLGILPLMPSYELASIVYLFRSVFNRSSSGAQQALTIGLVRDERRGLASSLNSVSNQIPRSIGPGIAAYLIRLGQLSLPFYIATVLQAIYLLLYYRVFRHYEQEEH